MCISYQFRKSLVLLKAVRCWCGRCCRVLGCPTRSKWSDRHSMQLSTSFLNYFKSDNVEKKVVNEGFGGLNGKLLIGVRLIHFGRLERNFRRQLLELSLESILLSHECHAQNTMSLRVNHWPYTQVMHIYVINWRSAVHASFMKISIRGRYITMAWLHGPMIWLVHVCILIFFMLGKMLR